MTNINKTPDDGGDLPKMCKTDEQWYFCGPGISEPKDPFPAATAPTKLDSKYKHKERFAAKPTETEYVFIPDAPATEFPYKYEKGKEPSDPMADPF